MIRKYASPVYYGAVLLVSSRIALDFRSVLIRVPVMIAAFVIAQLLVQLISSLWDRRHPHIDLRA